MQGKVAAEKWGFWKGEILLYHFEFQIQSFPRSFPISNKPNMIFLKKQISYVVMHRDL